MELRVAADAPGRYDTHYHLTKIPKVGFCLLPAMRSRSRHFLPSMLPFTIMHYMMLQINHNNCFASRLTEGCMSCTLKSDVSILPAILMLTLMLIISSIKALCFLTTRTQRYYYIGNCLSPILWGSDNLFSISNDVYIIANIQLFIFQKFIFYSYIITYSVSTVSCAFDIWELWSLHAGCIMMQPVSGLWICIHV